MRGFRASLIAALWLVLTAYVAGAGAAPRVWVEARLEPPQVPVNVQSTYILRFGHAVDVRAPRLDPPRTRLAEIVPLSPLSQREETRDGLRYRVHERRFAVLPFASGELVLETNVGGTMPAVLAESGGRTSFELVAPPVRLAVAPASAGADWLPARDLRLTASGEAPLPLRVGTVWTRQLSVEADGIDGSVIGAPRWDLAGESTADWTLHFDAPEFGRRIDNGRVTGFRRQTVHAQARRAGALHLPAVYVDWWSVPAGGWVRQTIPALAVEVLPALSAANGRPDAPVRTQGNGSVFRRYTLAAALVLLLVSGLLVGRSPALQRVWQRRQYWRSLDRACRAGDAPAARRALLDWVRAGGGTARSPEQIAAGCAGDAALTTALRTLEAACYGPASPAGCWDGSALRRALRRRQRAGWLYCDRPPPAP